jgi:hypothetical protein
VSAVTLSDILDSRAIDQYILVSGVEGAEAAMVYDDPALGRCHRIVIELHDTMHKDNRTTVDDLYRGLLARGFALLEQQGPVFAMERRS